MPHSTDVNPIWMLLLFPIAWVVISKLIAALGGWSTLSERYRFHGKFEGEKRYFVTGKMRGVVNYGSCLIVGANDTGLLLATLPPFRFAHPALMIPWSDVSLYQPKLALLPSVGFRFERCPSVTLRLYRGTANELINASNGAICWAERLPPAA